MRQQGIPLPYMDSEEHLTAVTYEQLYYRIAEIAMGAVKWYGLPKEINPLFLERYEFTRGNCVFFRDETMGEYLILPMSGQRDFDQNGWPNRYNVIGLNGYNRELDRSNSVIIPNNYFLTPSAPMASIFASRLTNTLRTGDVHLEAQKLGNIVAVPETGKKGMRELINRVRNFHLFTLTAPASAELTRQVQALQTQPDYIVDKLDNHYTFLWHECVSHFGVDSMSNKQSGVTQLETIAENGIANDSLAVRLEVRNKACEEIREMFGLNVRAGAQPDLIDDDGGAGDESLHNDTQDSDGGSYRETETRG